MEEEDNSITMVDVLKEQEAFEEDAKAVLGASDDKNCTYSLGYVKRQALYACLSCCPDSVDDPQCRAGVCLACSLACHENHNLVELYTKRSFRCDCAGPKFPNQCNFNPKRSENNTQNEYNQNFSGLYCTCHRPYPDPDDSVEDEMIQCIICEDWFHSRHLNAKLPASGQYSEMICESCTFKNDFLNNYLCFEANYCTAKENMSEQNSINENVTTSINEYDVPKDEIIDIESNSDNPLVAVVSSTPSTELPESENVKQTVESDNPKSNLEEDNISKDADKSKIQSVEDTTLSKQNDEECVNNIGTSDMESLTGSGVSENTKLNTTEDVEVISKDNGENAINRDDKTLETPADKIDSGLTDAIPINAEVDNVGEHTEEPKDTILMDTNASVEPILESTKNIEKMDDQNETIEDKIDINSKENIEEPMEISEKNENEILDDQIIGESAGDIEIKHSINEIMEEGIVNDKNDTDDQINMEESTKDIVINESQESIQDTLLQDVAKEKISVSIEENILEDENNIQNIDGKTATLEDKVLDGKNEKDTEESTTDIEIKTEDRISENKSEVENEESKKDIDLKEVVNETSQDVLPVDENMVDNEETMKDTELKDNINEKVEDVIPADESVVDNEEALKDTEIKDSINEKVEDVKPENKNVADHEEAMDNVNEVVKDAIPEDKNVVESEESMKDVQINVEKPENKSVIDNEGSSENIEMEGTNEKIEDNNESTKNFEIKDNLSEIIEEKILEDTRTDDIQNQESNHLNQTDISKAADTQENSMPSVVQNSSTILDELSVASSQNDQVSLENEDVKMAENANYCNDSSDKNSKITNVTDTVETMLQASDTNPENCNIKSNEDICIANKGEDETDPQIKNNQDLEENMEVDQCKNTENNLAAITSSPEECDSIVTGIKRKAEVMSTDKPPAMKKLKQENMYICIKPMCDQSYKIKGATFWPSDWRSKLCSCKSCSETYIEKKVAFILDFDDTVSAYEDLGKINSASTSSQYEKGMAALSSLGHIQQINAITEYNKMKEKLLEFLKTFKDKKEIVKEEDIKGFFAGMKPKREPDGVYFCR